MAVLPRAILVALLAALPFAGCLGAGSSKSFDPIPAPAWSAGNTWTLDSTESMSASGFGEDEGGEERTTSIVLRVFNTTEPFQGEPAYFVDVDGSDPEVENPFIEGSMLAYSQDDLRLLGRGADSLYPEAVPLTSPHGGFHDGYSPVDEASYVDPCEGRGRIEAVDESDMFPTPAFPLAAHDSRRGTWRPGHEDGPSFDYVMRVEGREGVNVPAGHFDAIHMSFDMLTTDDGSEEAFGSFRVHGDYWYAPEVRYYARMMLTATMSQGFAESGPGAFTFVSDVQLTSYDLATEAATPAPIAFEPGGADYRAYEIVSDVNVPGNVGEGPVEVRFALTDATPSRYDSVVRSSPAFPPAVPYDAEAAEVHWTLRSMYGTPFAVGTGPVFAHTFDRPGRFSIQADVRPRTCGALAPSSAYGGLYHNWEKTWDVIVEPAAQRSLGLGTFPFELYPSDSSIKWTNEGLGIDGGYATITDPYGREYRTGNGDKIHQKLPASTGDWRLDWHPTGPQTYLGSDLPPVGDEIRLTLRLDYSSEYPMYGPYY